MVDNLRLRFLGTGAGEGVPTPFCRCKVCEHARKVGGKEIRLRSCFRVSDSLLIDMGGDLAASCARLGEDLYDLEHILVSHSHEDHFAIGNLFLKCMVSRNNGKKLRVYMTGDSYHIVREYNSMKLDGSTGFYAAQLADYVEFVQLCFWETYDIGGFRITPIPGEHRGHTEQNSANYIVELMNGKKLLYALDTGYFGEETRRFLRNYKLDYVVMEATFGSAQRGDTPYSHLDLHSAVYLCDQLFRQGTIARETEVYFTHLNQEQAFTHDEMRDYVKQTHTPYSIEIAFDGLEIERSSSW